MEELVRKIQKFTDLVFVQMNVQGNIVKLVQVNKTLNNTVNNSTDLQTKDNGYAFTN